MSNLPMTKEEVKELLDLIYEAKARGDKAEESGLIKLVPLGKRMTAHFMQTKGEEWMRECGFKSYGEKYERPISK